nr:uncharacterized protein LOC129265124 [Lytechinus pictus]
MNEYAVVAFEDEDDAVALVSASWIVNEGGEHFSYWPGHQQTMRAKRHVIPDKQTWGRHKIRVLKVTSNYEKARSKARKAEETSNLDTDEESSQRKRHAPLRLLSESDSDADMELEPEPVQRSPRKAKAKTRELPVPKLLSTPSTSQQDQPPTPKARSSDNNFQQQVLQKLQKLEEVQAQILDRLADLAKSSPASWVGPADMQEPLSEPLKSIQEFDMLETKLAESEFKKRMINYLSLVGGVNIAQTSRRMMKKLGSNNLWSNFNVFGRKGKRGLKSTRFYPVIVRACVKTHQGVKETDIEEVLGDFLKRTPYLPGGSKWKKPDAVKAGTDGNNTGADAAFTSEDEGEGAMGN